MGRSLKIKLMVTCALSAAYLAGCDSKVVESTPESVRVNTTLDERLQIKTSMDENLFRVDRAIRGIKRITELFRKLNGDDEATYSTVDFLIDTNDQLKESFPSKMDNGDYVREARYDLPIEEIGADCKRVETRLTTTTRTPLVSASELSSDTLIYAFKTCGTDGQFLPILEFTFINNQMQLVVNNEHLIKVLNGLLNGYSQRQADCNFSFSTEKILTAFNCSNVEVMLERQDAFIDYAVIDKLSYDTTDGSVFALEARIFKDSRADAAPGQLKYTVMLNVDSSGDVKFEKTPATTSATPAATP